MDIVEELRKDKEGGAKRLEAEYKAGLMSLALRFCHDRGDAEELVNSTFATVVEHIDDYIEQSAFFAWMCQILTSKFSRSVRRKSSQMEVYPGIVPELEDEEAQEAIYRNLDASLLRDAIETLPPDFRKTIVMHYFMDMPVGEIAKVLSISSGTVKWRLHHARLALAAKMGVAAKKPGGKAVLLALLLCGLAALGAGVAAIANGWGEPSRRAAEAAERLGGDASPHQTTSTAIDGNRRQSTAIDGNRFDSIRQTSTALDTFPGEQTMKNTKTTRAAAMLAAATLATGAATTASADDYIWNVAEGETENIDATGVSNIGAKNLVKTGRGKLVSSADMAAYTGTITVREGAFEIKTTSDLGTADGGTVVEDGGTLVVNMSSGQERFSNEPFTIEGTGDAAYGAAVYQVRSNDRFKLFKYLTLSGDATIYAGTRLGVDGGTLAMDGHTLTLKGVNFQFRDVTYSAPIGNLFVESNTAFVRNQNATADPTKTLTIRNGGRIGFSEAYTAPSFWTLVVGEGGTIASFPSATAQWNGNVTWNSTAADNITGNISFNGTVTGTGTIKSSTATLAFAQPLGASLGLDLSGTATATLAPAAAYPYTHRGMMTGKRTDGWQTGFNTDRADTQWSYCAYGPGPQLVRDVAYWDENDTHSNGKSRFWCSRGYLWNREATNATYSVFVGSVYRNYIYLDGDYSTAVYDNKRDEWKSCSIEVPAQSCRQIDIRTDDGKAYGGPRSDNDKAKINGVIANDPTGYYFTTNAVSVRETPALPTLSLADNGALDANGMAMSVAALAGGSIVTNVTTLTVSDSWTLAATDVVDGDALTVHGDLAFGNGCAFDVTGLRNLELGGIYTVCTADAITGFATTEITDGHYKCELVQTGNRIDLVSIPKAMVLGFR